jgi:hypothetical protein
MVNRWGDLKDFRAWPQTKESANRNNVKKATSFL